ncbi:DPP IV N-terminal domain-containing protein [Emticicia sp.]|uniref:S9 family peptidase n=1 Tax=Emticicia sp. TaxID=1930953 RepID=UPI003752F06C
MKRTLLFLCLTNVVVFAQKKDFDEKELKSGKAPKNFTQPLPTFGRWIDDEKIVVTQKASPEADMKPVVLELASGKITDATPDIINPKNAPTKSVISKNGDLLLKNGSIETQLTNDKGEEKNATFSPDSSYIAYTKDNNLYTYSFKTKKEIQLTKDGTKTILNGYATWVYWEEIFGRPTRFKAFWWSPDSKSLAYMRFDESKTPMFPLYSSEGQHGFIEETRYPKSGDPNPEAKLGFVLPGGGSTTWVDFNMKEEHYLGWPEWLPDGSGLMVQWVNRGNDSLKMYNVSPKNGSKKEVYAETQKSWIGIDEADERLTIMDGGKEMMIISDKTGWKQLYMYGIDGTFKNNITEGEFTVKSVEGIDQKNRVVYFYARGIENTARFDLYRVGFDGKGMKRLTFGEFNHKQIQTSPNLKYFITTYSNINTPPQMAVIDNTGNIIRELGSAKGTEMDNYNLAKTELLRVKSDDGLFDLPMTIVYPQNMVAGKKYPVLISIYGGPDAGTVYDQWAWSTRSQWYAKEGIIQVALDHRASGHFGKEGVAYMHRNLGYWEMKDYKTMVKSLIDKGIADPTKICITGFSYGGYMSCYALTYGSDVFTHGMAGGSVTDWGLYDSAYTERYMDTPAENPDGYKSGSVMTHIDKYKGMLQIVHGTMDDNVHLQNSIQLISKLEDAKKNFEFMLYPNGRHGWGGAKGLHFDNLKTQFIYKHLLEKSVPEGLLK